MKTLFKKSICLFLSLALALSFTTSTFAESNYDFNLSEPTYDGQSFSLSWDAITGATNYTVTAYVGASESDSYTLYTTDKTNIKLPVIVDFSDGETFHSFTFVVSTIANSMTYTSLPVKIDIFEDMRNAPIIRSYIDDNLLAFDVDKKIYDEYEIFDSQKNLLGTSNAKTYKYSPHIGKNVLYFRGVKKSSLGTLIKSNFIKCSKFISRPYRTIIRKINKITKASAYIDMGSNAKKHNAKFLEVQYSTKANFKKTQSKTTEGKAVKLKKLKKNTRYYVRSRSIKIVGKDKHYSLWGKTKKFKTSK